MSKIPAPHTHARHRRATARVSLAAALTAAGCGNPAGNQSAAVQSDSNAATSIASLIPKLLTPQTLTEILNLLKSSNFIAALKQAWGSGVCKTEIDALTASGRALLLSAVKSGFQALLTGNIKLDLTGIKASIETVATCFEKEAPALLTSLTSALSSSTTTTSKIVTPDALVVTPEQINALDPNTWGTDGSPSANVSAPTGDAIAPGQAPEPASPVAAPTEGSAAPAAAEPTPDPPPSQPAD